MRALKTILLVAVAAALVTALAACGSSSSSSSTGSASSGNGSLPAGVKDPKTESLTGGKQGGVLNEEQSEDFEHLVLGTRDSGVALNRITHRLGIITGRGACAHPDGAVRLAASALRTFEPDLRAHLAGRPCNWAGRTRLPLPAWQHRSGDWR